MIVTALVLLYLVFGALNAYGFYLIGEVCERTGARTYQEAQNLLCCQVTSVDHTRSLLAIACCSLQAWTKTLGSRFAWMPSAASVICSFTGMVACIAVLGDTASQILTSMGQDMMPKEILIGGISSLVLFPLCLLPSLSPLAFASVLGLLGVTVLSLVMLLRWLTGPTSSEVASTVMLRRPWTC